MNLIYGYALLTIAATTSESSFDGFLQDRNPTYRVNPGFVFKEVQSYHSERLAEVSGVIHFWYPPETSVTTHLGECNWEGRGCTLQEKLLSKRILYFTKDVIYFECATMQRLEDPGYELPERAKFSMLLAESKTLSGVERLEKKGAYLSEWYETVMTYSRRKLTQTGDKLPAMQGLAMVLKDVVNDTYVYGLWKMDLHRGLLWHSWFQWPWKLPRGGYRAPTWSWACRDGSVQWDISTLKPGWKSLIQVAT